MIDLFCLVADRNMEAAVSGLLGRPHLLGIRKIRFRVQAHVFRDPGCFHKADDVLRLFRSEARHAIVMLDQAWDGVPCDTSQETEECLRQRLRESGCRRGLVQSSLSRNWKHGSSAGRPMLREFSAGRTEVHVFAMPSKDGLFGERGMQSLTTRRQRWNGRWPK